MANSSILAAFQRMWEHIAVLFNAKADTDLSNVDNTTLQNKATSAGLITRSDMEDYVGEHSGGNANVSLDNIDGILPITKGGTGATTASGALINLGISATATELNYVDGATSNIQTQLNDKADTDHTHTVSDVSGTLPVSKGGTGATTFTSGTAIIGNGTSAFSTRNITNNTAVSDSISGSTNLITLNTLRYALNRTTSVGYADTNYTTYMARGTSLNSAETTPTVNGTIAWTYE